MHVSNSTEKHNGCFHTEQIIPVTVLVQVQLLVAKQMDWDDVQPDISISKKRAGIIFNSVSFGEDKTCGRGEMPSLSLV